MTKAEKYVSDLYSTFDGRVPFTVGYKAKFKGPVYPFVFENSDRRAIGLVGVEATNQTNTSEVQLYHISTFRPGNGYGKEIMKYLCNKADEDGVKIYLQPETQFSSNKTPIGDDLVSWYHQFGFTGYTFLEREPNT